MRYPWKESNFFLCIETSTTNCSVALFNNSTLVQLEEKNDGYSHGELLASMVNLLLENNKEFTTHLKQ